MRINMSKHYEINQKRTDPMIRLFLSILVCACACVGFWLVCHSNKYKRKINFIIRCRCMLDFPSRNFINNYGDVDRGV